MTDTTRLIGLAGKARSGKDTLGHLMAEELDFAVLSFAEPIRIFIASLLDISVAEMEPIKEVPQDILGGKTPRQAMQTLGTEWGRNTIHFDMWVKACMRKAQRLLGQGVSVVVTDVRFNNEAQGVIDYGGEVIEITRPGNAGTQSGGEHVSEKGVDTRLLTASLDNTGTPYDLYRSYCDSWRRIRASA